MRCPKCQYLGFEPSPRCKNCGYDVSFSGDDLKSTMESMSAEAPPLVDFDLQVLDEMGPLASGQSMGFDLDDLLARGRSEPALPLRASSRVSTSAVATPPAADVLRIVEEAHEWSTPIEPSHFEPPPMERIAHVHVERFEMPMEPITVRVDIPSPVFSMPAPPEPETAVSLSLEPHSLATTPARRESLAPVTSELPLFMRVMSDVHVIDPATPSTVARADRAELQNERADRAGMPMTLEAATDAAGPMDMMAPESASAAVEDVDDRPLVQVPTVLRAPLAVRRTTPDPARLRAKYARAAKSEGQPAGDLLQGIDELDHALSTKAEDVTHRLSAEPTPQSLPAGWLQGVSAGQRFSAVAVDLLLLGSINAAVVWFTLSVCGLVPSQARLLPFLPIGLFFLLVDGGYLVLFTAACGQTIGKMVAGIRVVGTTTGAVINDRISVGQALARAIGAIASCLPLGAGLWVSLLGDGRALHDRIAHTRVVRA